MVHPHLRPPTLLAEEDSTAANGARPPRVEYLATLSRHSAAVNVVRFSPNGASATTLSTTSNSKLVSVTL